MSGAAVGDWKVAVASRAGTSHAERGDPCQDASLACEVSVGGITILVAACSDGAGSCPLAREGAALACDTFVNEASLSIQERHEDVDAALRRCMSLARARLATAADERAVPLHDFSCTLLAAVIAPTWAWFAQIGDGVIVVQKDDALEHVFWPQSGEYVNTTNFLTGDDFESQSVVALIDQPIAAVALLTDGLQSLALHYASRSVHAPFFEPMFRTLRESGPDVDLAAALRTFLDSPRVNERTDDDKTLILASRVAANR